MNIDLIIGRVNILNFMAKRFEVYSWKTVKRWKKKGMPFHYLWNKQPFLIEKEVIKWQLRQKP